MPVDERKYFSYEWALTDDETGATASVGAIADKTVQLSGTFNGATAVLQGSMDGTTWFTLNDSEGNPISTTTATLRLITENPRYVRPVISGGTSAAIACIIGGSALT